ncbi:hypothetical protein Ancab_010359 [Ancistrocladus abbreviatus]
MGKCENNFLFVSNAYRLVGIDLNSLQLELKSLLESRVSPRQSPPCPKLIFDIVYFKKKLPIRGSIFKSERHSKGYLVGGDFTNDVDARVVGFRKARQILSSGIKDEDEDEDEDKDEDEDEDARISNKVYEFDLLPCSSVNVENLMLEESKCIRGLNGCKSNPMVKKVNGFVYVLHHRPLCRSESGPPKPSFERINLESECEEWEALDDPPFLRFFDDGETRNVFSNIERTFTAAVLSPPNGRLSVFRVLDRYHVFVSYELDAPNTFFPLKMSPNNFETIEGLFVNLGMGKVVALMSGTTLNLELEGVLCISRFSLCVKPEVKAEVQNIERSVLVSFKPDERDFIDVVDVQNYIFQMNNEGPYQYLHGAFFA